MTSTLARIRRQQRNILPLEGLTPPLHAPEMLLIGCVDARLAIQDIGIPYGKALIYRNIAALVAGMNDAAGEHLSEAAALEFAINVMHVRDIVVMGHTDCGGIRACLDGGLSAENRHIRKYLSALDGVRDGIIAEGGDHEAQARAMEMAAVAQSVQNLRTYEAVSRAEGAGALRLHGWVINTATRRISEMDGQGRFVPMGG